MKSLILAVVTSVAIAAPLLAAPQYAFAYRPAETNSYAERDRARSIDYGRGDLCQQQRRDAATRGTVAGAVIGGIIGNRVAGRGDRTAGTIVGAAVGGVAGNQIGRQSVRCVDRPARISYQANCQWLEDQYGQYEVCRNRNGDWRPSGRG